MSGVKGDVMTSGDQSSAIAVYIQQIKQQQQQHTHSSSSDVIRFFKSKGAGGSSSGNYFYSLYGLDAVMTADEYFKTRVALKYNTSNTAADDTCAYQLVDWLEQGQVLPRERCELLRAAILRKMTTNSSSGSSDGGSGSSGIGILPSTNVNQTLYERIVADLLVKKRCSVEVWEKSGSGSSAVWRRVKKGSPGNVQDFEEIVMDTGGGGMDVMGISGGGGDVGGGTMCVRVQQTSAESSAVCVGVAFCSTTQRIIHIAQFDDNDQFSILESALVQTGVAECCHEEEHVLRKRRGLHAEALVERLLDVMRKSDVAVTSLPANAFPAVSAKVLHASTSVDAASSGGSGSGSIMQVEEDLESLVSNYNELGRTLSTEMPLALSAAGALLSQLGLMEDVNNRGYYRLEKYHVGDYMMMDGSAMRALNIMPSAADGNAGGGNSGRSHTSLFGLINAHVRTRMGSRTLHRWLRQPLVHIDEIERRHDLVDGLLADSVTRASIMDMIGRGIPDMDRLIKRFHRQSAKLEDLMKVYQAVQVLPELAQAINEFARGGLTVISEGENQSSGGITERVYNRFHADFVESIVDLMEQFAKLEDLVESAIDVERFRTEHECLIHRDYDEELAELDDELQRLTAQRRKILVGMRNELRDVLVTGGRARRRGGGSARKTKGKGKKRAKQDDDDNEDDNDDVGNYAISSDVEDSADDTGIEMRGSAEKGDMFHFRVTYSAGEKVRKAGFDPIAEKTGKSKGFCWTTKELRELSAEYLSTYAAYHKQMAGLAGEVLKVSASFIPVMERMSTLVARLDVLCAFAQLSQQMQYSRPTMYALDCSPEEERIVLRQTRHPMLEAQPEQTRNRRGGGATVPGSFQPNDVEMIRDGSSFLIITGPNMGGKSTYCRSAALCVLMAQVGCFVPCESAEIAVRDCILCRVGASDSTTRGVSTFMSEMLETSTILKNCTARSLILIDELGRGTSTYDGFGLAWAISKYIIKEKRSFCLFATHFHELTTLAHDTGDASSRSVKNLKVIVRAPDDHDDDNDDSGEAGMETKSDGMLHFLYRVVEGTSDKSLGVAVAKLAHFPHEVLVNARRKIRQLESLSRWNASTSMTADSSDDHDDNEPEAKRRKMMSSTGEGEDDEGSGARLYQLFPAGRETARDDVEKAINALLRNHAMNDYSDPDKSFSLIEKLHVAVERCIEVSPELRRLVEELTHADE